MKVKTFHPNDETRAARLAWNTLLTLAKCGLEDTRDFSMVIATMKEMNKNGLFEKQGEVLEGPIRGDFDGIPFSFDMLPDLEVTE